MTDPISPARIAAASRVLEDKACVVYFLLGAVKENLFLNGRSAWDAFDSYARLQGYDPAMLRDALEKIG